MHSPNYTFRPPKAGEALIVPQQAPSSILLIGDPSVRPEGLERLLVRAGFQVTEAPYGTAIARPAIPPHLVLYSVGAPDAAFAAKVRDIVAAPEFAGVPVFALVGDGGPDAVAEALRGGATDAVANPVHFAELSARLESHLRSRATLKEARDALLARDLLFDIFQEVSAALRADEIFQTLVRRVGQAFGLRHCSFVLTAPGEDDGRVVAVYENPAIRDLRVELERYPEIQEAIRTEQPVVIHDVHDHPLFASVRRRWVQQEIHVNVQAAVALPVFVQGRAAGVFFLRTVRGDPELRPQDVAFANTIAQAAARVLENGERRAAMYRRQISAGVTDAVTGCASLDALDRRLRDEFERARRYSLRFALVLLDIDRLRDVNERLGQAAGDRLLAEVGSILQREIRAPDFVARYGGDEFALILPETDTLGGRQFVARLRHVVSRTTFADLGPGTLPSLSAGVVAFPHSEALRPEDLFTLAEGALARGKNAEPDRIGAAVAPGIP
ncbi:MAG TPA: diguanylate cyclase [Gemmatimonadales bacterium]|nr:diguanylate cyclase [Gemmatimonadales bacterium]